MSGHLDHGLHERGNPSGFAVTMHKLDERGQPSGDDLITASEGMTKPDPFDYPEDAAGEIQQVLAKATVGDVFQLTIEVRA